MPFECPILPHIHTLYLLLRVTGLARIEGTATKQRVRWDPDALDSWGRLNPTERYFTLLETWLLRARAEIIGEELYIMRNPIGAWAEFFQRIAARGLRVAGDKSEEQTLMYFPGFMAIAMLELFGLVTIQHGTPPPGTGWRITKVSRTPWGDALLQLLSGELLSFSRLMRLDDDLDERFGDLQELVQPYFPEWRHNLALPAPEFQDGTYIFKVSLGRIWRRIAIPGRLDLDHLSDSILRAYQFDHDHLYRFSYKNRFRATTRINHPYMDEPPFTPEVRVGDLPLHPGTTLTYLYDFGDHWEFDVTLERIDPVDPKMRRAQIVETHGKAPKQYHAW
jgi:hypothetical protein